MSPQAPTIVDDVASRPPGWQLVRRLTDRCLSDAPDGLIDASVALQGPRLRPLNLHFVACFLFEFGLRAPNWIMLSLHGVGSSFLSFASSSCTS